MGPLRRLYRALISARPGLAGRAPAARLDLLRACLLVISLSTVAPGNLHADALLIAGNTAAPAGADRSNAMLRHLTVALPEGLSPRTIGYYLADAEGYFHDRGLAVDFISSTSETPSRLLADGKADLAVELMPIALQLHQSGAALQNVAQFFQHGTLALYCRPPIAKPADLHGTTIGVWFGGEESSFYAWMSRLNISTFGEEDGVTVLRQGRGSSSLADSRLDCATSASYLAPRQMLAGGVGPTSRTVFRYDDLGVGTLEDGLYARTKDLAEPDRLDLYTRFLAATIRGWQKLHDDRAAALRLFRFDSDKDGQRDHSSDQTAAAAGEAAAADKTSADKSGAGTTRQRNSTDRKATDKLTSNPGGSVNDMAALKTSLDAVDAGIDPIHYKIGLLDPDSYDRTVNLLLTGAPEPVLQGAPQAATSDLLWQHLRQLTGPTKP